MFSLSRAVDFLLSVCGFTAHSQVKLMKLPLLCCQTKEKQGNYKFSGISRQGINQKFWENDVFDAFGKISQSEGLSMHHKTCKMQLGVCDFFSLGFFYLEKISMNPFQDLSNMLKLFLSYFEIVKMSQALQKL